MNVKKQSLPRDWNLKVPNVDDVKSKTSATHFKQENS